MSRHGQVAAIRTVGHAADEGAAERWTVCRSKACSTRPVRASRICERPIHADRGDLPAVRAEGHADDRRRVLEGRRLAVALPLEEVPLPAAQVLRAVVEQLLGAADVAGGQLALRQGDALEVRCVLAGLALTSGPGRVCLACLCATPRWTARNSRRGPRPPAPAARQQRSVAMTAARVPPGELTKAIARPTADTPAPARRSGSAARRRRGRWPSRSGGCGPSPAPSSRSSPARRAPASSASPAPCRGSRPDVGKPSAVLSLRARLGRLLLADDPQHLQHAGLLPAPAS